MSNTTTISGSFITITGLDADWSLATDAPFYAKSGLYIKSITFNPSAASDVFVVRERKATGSPVFEVSCADGNDQKIEYYGGSGGQQMWPYIKIADATLDTAANASVKIKMV